MSQCCDGLHTGRLEGRLKAGQHSDDNDDGRDDQQIGRIDRRRQEKTLLLAKVKLDSDQIDHQYNGNTDKIADNGPQNAETKTLNDKHGEDLAWQGADGGDGADFPDPLIDGHDHDIHDADENDCNEHDLDEEGHHVDHPGDVEEGRELFPRVDLEDGPPLLVDFSG